MLQLLPFLIKIYSKFNGLESHSNCKTGPVPTYILMINSSFFRLSASKLQVVASQSLPTIREHGDDHVESTKPHHIGSSWYSAHFLSFFPFRITKSLTQKGILQALFLVTQQPPGNPAVQNYMVLFSIVLTVSFHIPYCRSANGMNASPGIFYE